MSETRPPDLAALLRDILQQQTAMLQVQSESVRLQRVLVERLFGAPADPSKAGQDVTAPAHATAVPEPPSPAEPRGGAALADSVPDMPNDLPRAADQNLARGARYYLPGPSPVARPVAPEQLELMRRLQELREPADLILQFGPHKGSTLAQIAMHHPDYIRQLTTRAQRPEVRAAAGRLVEALDAAAEHKRAGTRESARRARAAT